MVKKANVLSFESVLSQAEILQHQIADGWRGVAQNMLALAQREATVEAFIAGAGKAESERRTRINEMAAAQKLSDEERRRQLRLPQSWSNAKSQIKRIWEEYGVHPQTFDTYYALRARLTELRKSTKQIPRLLSGVPGVTGEAKEMFQRLAELPAEYQHRVIETAMRLIDTYNDAARRVARASTPAPAAAQH